MSPQARSHRRAETADFTRPRWVMRMLFLFLLVVLGRLFYWQVIHRSVLLAEAENQYSRTVSSAGHRGKIFSSDGYTLVTNAPTFRLFAQPNQLQESPEALADKLAPLLLDEDPVRATDAAQVALDTQALRQSVLEKLQKKDLQWIALKQRVNQATKEKIQALKLSAVGFDQYETRAYPEASMAAHVLGFVGKDKAGDDQGYFGVEGALDRELKGYNRKQTFFKDALGFHLLFDQAERAEALDGRDVVLTIRRDMQYVVEDMLKKGMAKYGASQGEVIVMDPKTGKILAMASFPNYDPGMFYQFDPGVYKNPALTDVYEPGSTFKVLTVAAGVDAGAITPETQCTNCDRARQLGSYTIKTWNDQYNPNVTIRDALAKSDNVAMIFVAELLGKDKFLEYMKKFKIGDETRVELQEDTSTPLRKDWKPIDLATGSFGQGIATNGLQMVRAVGAIANQGNMMRPLIIEKVIDHLRGTEVHIESVVENQVITPATAAKVTEMMVHAAGSGEAKWISSKTHLVAGKTGTAQIPIDGHYDATKTVATFIGFAPPSDPKFVMLVKLREPSSSQWASETAAPLWYQIADKLYLLMNIPADR